MSKTPSLLKMLRLQPHAALMCGGAHSLRHAVQREAWLRRRNSWRRQELRRAAAEERWRLRAAMAEAHAAGQYLFQDTYEAAVARKSERARYGEFRHAKAGSADGGDQLVDAALGSSQSNAHSQ